jgi:hypothetical protein
VVVTELRRLLEAARVEQKSENLQLFDTKRSNDIAFFGRKGDNGHYANLRLQVASMVTDLHGISSGNRKLRTIVRFFGELTLMGSTIVFARYVEEMVGAKVIVVAQRDEWEDHYPINGIARRWRISVYRRYDWSARGLDSQEEHNSV